MYWTRPDVNVADCLTRARACKRPATIPAKRNRMGARRLGELYERRVHAYYTEKYGSNYQGGQWFEYEAAGRKRYCQTDSLLLFPDKQLLMVGEIKFRHTSDAFFQLNELYYPVVQRCFPGYRIGLVEITRWFDPAIPFPCKPVLIKEEAEASPTYFGVRILNL